MAIPEMGMDDTMGGGGGPPAPAPAAPPTTDEGEKPSTIFLSKEVLGGRTVKKGDRLSVVIDELDPETGDCEGTIEPSGAGGQEGDSEGGINADFDKAMPPEPGEGSY